MIGWPVWKIWKALHRGRIPRAQKVGSHWVIAEDATILRANVDLDPYLYSLPERFIAEKGVAKDYRKLEELEKLKHKAPGNLKLFEGRKFRKVTAWGYNRLTKGMTNNEIYRVTGVHHNTQKKLRAEEEVEGSVVLRLSEGLAVPVEDLLRRKGD
jgi:hypothetical protein